MSTTLENIDPIGKWIMDQYKSEVDSLLSTFEKRPNLGVSREDMPQIDDIDGFVAELTKNGVPTRKFYCYEPEKINPTQDELSDKKIYKNLIKDNKTPGFWRDRVYIISNDGYLLDGHHTWILSLRELLGKQDKWIKVIQVDLPMSILLEMARNSNLSEYKALHESILGFSNPYQAGDRVFDQNNIAAVYDVNGDYCRLNHFTGELSVPVHFSQLKSLFESAPDTVNENFKVKVATIREAEQAFKDMLAGTKKIQYECGTIFYFDAEGILVKLWPDADNAYGYVVELTDRATKALTPDTIILNEDSYIPGNNKLPDTFLAFLKAKNAVFRPMTWFALEQDVLGILYLPVTPGSTFKDMTPGDRKTLADTFQSHLEAVTADLSDKMPCTFIPDSATILLGKEILKDGSLYGSYKKEHIYASVMIRVHLPQLSDYIEQDQLTSILNAYPSYGIIPGRDHEKLDIYVPFHILDSDFAEIRKTIIAKHNIQTAGDFLQWLNLQGDTVFNKCNILINSNNLVFRDLISDGFMVVATGVYTSTQVAKITKQQVRQSGYLYMRFNVNMITDMNESARVIKTLLECAGYTADDIELPDEYYIKVKDAEAYQIPLTESKIDTIRTAWNFMLGKGKKIKQLGKSLETAMVQKVVVELDTKLRTRAMKGADKSAEVKNIKDIARHKIETQTGIITDTKEKMDQIAGKDKRLQRVASRTKTNASLEANKKKLDYLTKLNASPNAVKETEDTIKQQEQYLQNTKADDPVDNPNAANKPANNSNNNTGNNSDANGSKSEETTRSAPATNDTKEKSGENTATTDSGNGSKQPEPEVKSAPTVDNSTLDTNGRQTKANDLAEQLKNEKDPTKRSQLNLDHKKTLADLQEAKIKDSKAELEEAKKSKKSKDIIAKIEQRITADEKRKKELDDQLTEVQDKAKVEQRRIAINSDIDEINTYIKEQTAELKTLIAEIKTGKNSNQQSLLIKKKEYEENIINSKIEAYQKTEQYYELVGDIETAAEYKKRREKAYQQLKSLNTEDRENIGKNRANAA